MSKEIVFREKFGNSGPDIVYLKPVVSDRLKVVKSQKKIAFYDSIFSVVKNFIYQVFLPLGYPDSVSDDYLSYQLWDTIQAFCSTITGTLTTQAVMKGVGVGNAEATPLAAAITWIMKDGTGLIGSILFAWWKCTSLDADCKKWRLFADVVNDIAMCIELTLPYIMDYSMEVLCVSTTLKAIVGVAGGATRAAITQHQAIKDNMADVSAKDGSQEKFVNLAASFAGIAVLSSFDQEVYMWQLFTVFTIFHLFSNYCAVKSLNMRTFNAARYAMLLSNYITTGKMSAPNDVNNDESVILGIGFSESQLCGFKISMGNSLQDVLSSNSITAEDWELMKNVYQNESYILIPDVKKKIIYVTIKSKETALDVLKAYFHAVFLGISISALLKQKLEVLNYRKTNFIESSFPPVKMLVGAIREANYPLMNSQFYVVIEVMQCTMDVIQEEFVKFRSKAEVRGWNMKSHHLIVDEWRADWTTQD